MTTKPPFLALGLSLFACLGLALPATALPSQATDDVRVVIKFVKADAGMPLAAVFDPESCRACTLVQDTAFARNNAVETLVDLRVPRRRTLDLQFDAPSGAVRRVVLETGDIAFSEVGGRLTVHLPPLAGDAINSGEFHTHIVEPGMVVRFEHDDPIRRAGAYAEAPLDFVERRAADTLTFAQREAVRILGIGHVVQDQGLGTIMLMGFDTNYPHAHSDAPAHFHMHMRWPDYAGTQISHYYIDRQGLLTHNLVGIQMLNAAERRFGRGETFTTLDRRGRPVYAHTITSEGWLDLSDGGDGTCRIRPIEKGFQSGALVACLDLPDRRIQVKDDLKAGVLTVTTDQIEEIFRYDVDTGVLVSAAFSPKESASSYPPD